jgi:3D (Asp-Asp-Asp) domain-containing protein
MKSVHLYLFGIACLLAGCASPVGGLLGPGALKPGKNYRVKTTAYTGKRNAIGQRLQHGPVISAAADWSEFPLGTRFRILENGKNYIIDDYGSAMVGTRTIDLCMPSNSAMCAWGVRWVNIEILEWGSPRASLEVLSPRKNAWYVRRMLSSLQRQSKGIPQQFHRKK